MREILIQLAPEFCSAFWVAFTAATVIAMVFGPSFAVLSIILKSEARHSEKHTSDESKEKSTDTGDMLGSSSRYMADNSLKTQRDEMERRRHGPAQNRAER